MSFLEWLSALAQDADPARPGFQAKGLYLLLCVAGPVLFGLLAALTLRGIERVFGIKLSAKGGH